MTLIEKMYDLLKQATTEKSHYYTRSILTAAIEEIERLEHLHALDHSLANQWQAKNEALEKELSILKTKLQFFEDLSSLLRGKS